MTLLDIRPPAGTDPGADASPISNPDDGDRGVDATSNLQTCLAITLSTAAAAVMLSGVFTGATPRVVALAPAVVGPSIVLLSYRFSRPALVQYLTAPLAIAIGTVLALAGGGTGSASLPTLVADAVRGGGLGQPPVAFVPGWRFLLVVVITMLGAGAASLGTGLSRPRLGICVAVPAVVGGALVQPPGSAVTNSAISLVLLVAGLVVASTATDAAGASFEIVRLVRAVGGLVLLGVALTVLGQAGFLLPTAKQEHVVPPRPPTVSPPLSDRVLFTVTPASGADSGPWLTGVLDSYRNDTWLLPAFDRSKLIRIRSGRPLPSAPGVATQSGPRRITVRIGDLPGKNLPALDLTRTIDRPDLSLQWDPHSDELLSVGQQAPAGTSYVVTAEALPTADQLTHAGNPPASMASYLSAPAAPPAVAHVLAAAEGDSAYQRLQAVRTYLYSHVVAEGRGIPVPVSAARVAQMFAGSHATPFEITAAEALLARWAGVPSRIGFGYEGGIRLRDASLAVHPVNGSTWLQTWWSGIGWVSIVGRPAQAVTPTSLAAHQHDLGVRTNGQLALVVHVPVRLASLRGLYDDIRYYVLVTLPWVLLLALLVIFHPVAWKLARAQRRARWARHRGPAAHVLVAYASLRDRLRDLNAPLPNATPLEFCAALRVDDEHAELAWLVTRCLWGDLARDLRAEDVDAAQEMSRSIRRRVLRAQKFTARVAAAASRASLRDPWTRDIPNAWPARRVRLRISFRLRPRARLRAPAPAAAALLVVLMAVVTGCSGAATARAVAALPARFVPSAVGQFALDESPTAEQAFVHAGKASLVTGGKVWTVVAPDGSVVGSVQAAAFKAEVRGEQASVQQGVRRSLGEGHFTLTRVGAHAVYALSQSDEQLLLYFAPDGSYYELLDARADFSPASQVMAALIDYQLGSSARTYPVALDPRRGGD